MTSTYDTPVEKIWSQGIIASHLILLFFMIGFFSITYKLKNRNETNTTMFVMQYFAMIVILVSGIVIVTFDQLVTSNITPFSLVCIVSGLVFLIRPLVSTIIYVTAYIAYYFLIALTITNEQMLLTNRVNGISAVGMGLLLSIILWQYNYTNIIQKRRIENQQKQLEQMAYYDSLTDLPNRRMLKKLLEQEFSSMQRYGHKSVIIILDIDDFKVINDTYGHLAGDEILRQLADLLKNNVREIDTVIRLGGEEFIILMPDSSLEEGYTFAESLRKQIMGREFIFGPTVIRITCSFGVSALDNLENLNMEEYYSLADKALYRAKRSGKNKVETASESTPSPPIGQGTPTSKG